MTKNFKLKKVMKAMRFELMHPKIPEPKSGALNHSAKLPFVKTELLWLFKFQLNFQFFRIYKSQVIVILNYM